MMTLLDREGLRHEIDVEHWVSRCCQWVVIELGVDTGFAERHIEVATAVAVHFLGSSRTEHIAGRDYKRGEALPFSESSEPITCFWCIVGDPP
jgi:hypothetical protein